MMFRRIATTVVVLASAFVVPAVASPVNEAGDRRPAPVSEAGGRWPATVSGVTADRYPEGVTWDPTRQAFLVGSMATGRINVVDKAGRVRVLVQQAPGVSTFGLHVDAVRNRFLVTYADIGNGEGSTPATTYRQSGVAIYNLRTGRLQHRVDLNTPHLNPAGGKHGANDLAIDRAGNAYVTDPAADAIYRITPTGKASVLVRDPRLQGTSIGMNGIVWDPAGYLLAVQYDSGRLFRITLRGQISQVKLAQPLVGGDGLALTRDRRLVVVTNALGAPGADRVSVLRSSDDYRSAQVVSAKPLPIAGPTTVALSPHGAYVLSGRIDVLLGGGQSDQFDLQRV
ncbi:SMP-30/gluconolactonase/LRE family protein [Kribbella sp. NPDC023855]|uniref:SMP-30/gluconolactonase/LRE family protein n=1 Tax=Kribbella sp. NPDC023855 TaxID=3154698 RepID=UPI0033CDE9DE